ncbi:hypothetical protein NPIL_693631 [Nephila pilipes]|uniref:Uncharacterized protein n=1 Tax=Nephila pilipes TaxID=299642 RepID=A0A8X6NJ18_NEPPI|nr:hypothetical protein NPIL_693631 [Nephila pilipes]
MLSNSLSKPFRHFAYLSESSTVASLALHCDNSSLAIYGSLNLYSEQPIESLPSNLRKPIAKRALPSSEETFKQHLEAVLVKTPSTSILATLSSNGIDASVCLPTWKGK